METPGDFYKGAANGHIVLAKGAWNEGNKEVAIYHLKRAKEEIKKARKEEEIHYHNTHIHLVLKGASNE